jgi:beta-galactosidase
VSGAWGPGESKIWAEQIAVQSPETKTLMTYGKSNGWLDDQPAAVTRKVGQGSITYLGMSLEGATAEAAAKWMLADAGVAPALPVVPEGIDLAIRSGDGKKILILTNYNTAPQTIKLGSPMHELLTGTTASAITLPQYGVAVLSAP